MSPRHLLQLSALLAGVAAERVVVPFNTGWRFHAGDDLPYQCSTPDTVTVFPISLNNVQVTGLQSASASDAASCMAQCNCTCQAWQWEPSQGCYIGLLQALGPSNIVSNISGWVGGGRFGPAAPPDQTTGPATLGFNDSATFVDVTVPHDYLASGVSVYSTNTPEQAHGYIPFANAWYRNSFTVPAAYQGALLRLHFEAVYRSADYFLNGVWLGHHESGYTPSDWWLHNATGSNSSTPVLRYGGDGPNVFAVRVDGTTFQELWSYEGAGITREVTLIVITPPAPATPGTPVLSIMPHGVYPLSQVRGPVTAAASGPYDGPQTAAAGVYPQTDVANAGPGPANYTVTSTVIDPSGAVVASVTSAVATLAAGGWARVSQALQLPTAALWFPAANASSPPPPLYTLTTTLAFIAPGGSGSGNGGAVVADAVNTTFGIRTATLTADSGLLINGFPVKITGMSAHSDFGGCGNAVPPNMWAYRVQRLLELGANGWRTAHNPPSQHLLDEADRRGVLVWLENRFLRGYSQQFVQDAQDMVYAGRAHPSVIFYSLGNENGLLEAPGMEGAIAPAVAGGAVAESYMTAMYKADGTRPITANTHALIDQPGTILDAIPVLGVTYDYDAYDSLHLLRPWTPVLGGESASCTSDRGFSISDNGTAGTASTYGTLGCTGPAWSNVALRPWISGNFVWAYSDYRGESYWPAVHSHYGVLDYCGFDKDVAHWYSAWWGGQRSGPGGQPVGDPTVLHAFPAWDGAGYANEPGGVTIVAYTAAQLVSLSVNGEVIGNKSVPQYGWAQWEGVAWAPGSYTVTAYSNASSSDGSWQQVATYTSVTPGGAAALQLNVTWPGAGAGGALVTDGVDSALVTVAALDAAGRIASTTPVNVTFTITAGPARIYGSCSGNPSDGSAMTAGSRVLYSGLARAVVQSVAAAGGPGVAVTVTAAAPGLQPASVTLQTAAPANN